MDGPPPQAAVGPSRSLADLDSDMLAHCASFLDLGDLAKMAMASSGLRRAAYSDTVWRRLFSKRWPNMCVSTGASGVREEYLARNRQLLQLKFDDPSRFFISAYPFPPSHILLNKNDVFLAQGSVVQHWTVGPMLDADTFRAVTFSADICKGHTARITCMRLIPLFETSMLRNEKQNEDSILITSSSDRTIRLWWKGHSQRCFRGHNGPVTALADKLLGDCGSKVLASGGEDCTVRLWSVTSTGKRCPLAATYYGHEKPVSLLSVSGYKASLLVSISKDARVRVWDTASSSSSTYSACVGMARASGLPIGLKCQDTLCYIAAGSSVVAVDLRTMQKVHTVAVHSNGIYSFEMLPSKCLVCTGAEEKAMLWDIRKNQEKPEPVANLEAENRRVTIIHMDPYKIVTGGPFDFHVNVWETDTGCLANSLDCRIPGETENIVGLSAMAVDRCRIVTTGCTEEPGVVYYRDFSNCIIPSSAEKCNTGSKFWEPQGVDGDLNC